MKNVVMKKPNKEKWKEISDGFKKHAMFSNYIGGLDGKHVRIK
ncbi:unnamed protein product [Acanthoscelides obtectus]|uniref:DDE Tnp4 domain-containing protein n=1 Tax=Acanthoscelides obtectus TaxID=200917 RepID=A0A9P0LXG7_ACAOB|nr:unnamed protein product [Acanthoscelides obtectus]CAK1662418.1 hypothetical protein AOBTE_LOCUS23141 [Acanthoscelides obtectus]